MHVLFQALQTSTINRQSHTMKYRILLFIKNNLLPELQSYWV